MRFLLDSCVCIDFLRGRSPSLLSTIQTLDPRDIGIPAAVEAELRYGVTKGARPAEELAKLERFLSAFEIVPFDSACAVHYGRIRADLERKGMTIGPIDYLIASTALSNASTLVTRNIREFRRVPGLLVENWEELG